MQLTAPKYSKSQVLKMAGISSAQFNNWMIRGLIPRTTLGFKLVKQTKAKYSILVVAYCRLLACHTGQDRKLYIKTLTQLFEQVALNNELNQHMVIAIDALGKGKDCAVFDSPQLANQTCTKQHTIVPVGQIITTYMETSKNEPTV